MDAHAAIVLFSSVAEISDFREGEFVAKDICETAACLGKMILRQAGLSLRGRSGWGGRRL